MPPPLRCCLLSGGLSRRMGRDKALLHHPEGGTWLERQLRLLAELGAPLTLLSGWSAHLRLAEALAPALAARGVALEPLPEPRGATAAGGPQGPLVALGHLMEAHPDGQLLLCPVDMPALSLPCLRALRAASQANPGVIWIAAGERPQPLLGLYPSDALRRQSLRRALRRGERSLRRWLAGESVRSLPLPSSALLNLNTPAELERWRAGPGGAAAASGGAPRPDRPC